MLKSRISRRAFVSLATGCVLAASAVALGASGALPLSAGGSGSGSPASAVLASSVCGSAAGGYYEVAADGGVFTFGGARYYGSMAGQHLNVPIVGIIPTAGDGGYWLVAADGGIFSFGDARFAGSMGGTHLNMPVTGGAAPAAGGCPGPQGVPGPQGASGNTILSGTTSPPSTLGNAGDFYLDTTTGTLYGPKTSTGWPTTGTSLIGPQGPTGPQGSQGPAGTAGTNGTNGTNGNTILSGTTTPASTLGAVGDFFLDTTSETLYGPKTSTGWPSTGTSLVGPAGPSGPAGVAGITYPALQSGSVGADSSSGYIYASCPSGSEVIAPEWAAGNNVIEGLSMEASSSQWEFDFFNQNSTSQTFFYGVVCAQVG